MSSLQPRYAELHAHTNFSFLDGASHPEEMANKGKKLGLAALAATDHDGVYGAVRFSRAVAEANEVVDTRPWLKAIVGMEITLEGGPHLTLLARDRQGYSNVCLISTEAHRDRPKGHAELSLDFLAQHSKGLVGLSGCKRGEIPTAALVGHIDRATELAGVYGAMFEPGCFYLELQNHLHEEEIIIGNRLIDVSRSTGIPLVATNNAHYHERSRKRLQDVLVCIKHRKTLRTAGRLLRHNGEYCLKSPEEMARLFDGVPQAITNTLHIADMCDFDLSKPLQYGLPKFPTPRGDSEYEYLEKLAWEGVERLYSQVTDEVRRRVNRELKHVRENDLAGYFLTVREIVQFCHDNDILVNTRGSAPSSILCYALKISLIDPISANLMFERFMSSQRGEPPDIDLDIEHQERERVIQHVYERYGRDRAGMVANVIAFRGRSAIRDVGKALGLPLAQVDRLSKHLQWHHSSSIEQEVKEGAEFPSEIPNQVASHLLELCRQIDDFPRHLGIHTGGMVISSRPLPESVPIEPATMQDRTVIQWDKDDCADAGLMKIDLLGLGMMTMVHRAFRLLEQQRGEKYTLDSFRPYDHPNTEKEEDKDIYDAICAADTLGLFQIESRAQINALPRTRPRVFYDLVIEVAIIRPGPMTTKMHRRWILRRAGREDSRPVWPGLKKALERTLGLPLFQEQCMQMAIDAAGFSPAKADALRRAMTRKRSLQHIQALKDDLMRGMARKGVPQDAAEQIYQQIEGYAGYGFPEAHSWAFAILVYVSAWLKVRRPAEFLCAILNSQPMGFYHPHTLIGDAQRHGVTVRSVDVQCSRFDCTMEPDGTVRMGYRYVKGVGEVCRPRLDSEIERGKYRSLEDFCRRTRLPIDMLRNLATAGAFRSFGIERREALWRIQAYAPAEHGDEIPSLADELEEEVGLKPANEMTQMRMDFAATQLSTVFRGIEFHRPTLERAGVLTATELQKLAARLRDKRPSRNQAVRANGSVRQSVADESAVR
ncbi:MAG: error-prone DNA polymerase [Chloroflexi bacterium]|nr:error-prone DNA polymerase [Chloroflexota bacterium]MCY3938602.1 error-prone DNA polymerase [Chloroflexota bacterium]